MGTRITTLREIVDTRTAGMIDGILVDLFTASAMVLVHDALSEPNRARFDSIPLPKLAAFCLSKVS